MIDLQASIGLLTGVCEDSGPAAVISRDKHAIESRRNRPLCRINGIVTKGLQPSWSSLIHSSLLMRVSYVSLERLCT